jgi:hypothetical protein
MPPGMMKGSPPRMRWMAPGPSIMTMSATPAETGRKTPIVPGRPADSPAAPPRHRVTIPIIANPRFIVVSGAVNDDAVLGFGAEISRCVAFIHVIAISGVNANISQIVQWRTGRNRVDDRRHTRGNNPRAAQGPSRKPNPILASEPRMIIDFDDRRAAVFHVRERRT